jgi:hypothetical protein
MEGEYSSAKIRCLVKWMIGNMEILEQRIPLERQFLHHVFHKQPIKTEIVTDLLSQSWQTRKIQAHLKSNSAMSLRSSYKQALCPNGMKHIQTFERSKTINV